MRSAIFSRFRVLSSQLRSHNAARRKLLKSLGLFGQKGFALVVLSLRLSRGQPVLSSAPAVSKESNERSPASTRAWINCCLDKVSQLQPLEMQARITLKWEVWFQRQLATWACQYLQSTVCTNAELYLKLCINVFESKHYPQANTHHNLGKATACCSLSTHKVFALVFFAHTEFKKF